MLYNEGATNHIIQNRISKNGNFVEFCIHKPKKCTKPENSQIPNICCS